jgi:Zn-dependent protease/CBS domain-containing protein
MGMRNWSLPAGRIFGVEIRIHLTFLMLLFFVLAVDSISRNSVARSVAVVLIVFGSVVLHELGHAIVARRAGLPARAIVLLPLGGVTVVDDTFEEHPNPRRDARIALSGPLVSLVIALLSAVVVLVAAQWINLFGRPWITTQNLPRTFVWANVFLGVFNLLPAYPMDGGRILRSYFSTTMDPINATRRAVMIGQTFAMAFMLIGFGTLVSYPNRWGSWLILIGFFLFIAGQLEDRSAVFQAVLENVRMGEVMLTDFRTLSPADTLEDALQLAVHTLQDDFPVVRAGDMVGVISKNKIVEALRRGGNGYIQPVMNKMFEVAGLNDSLATAFRKITGRGLTMIPVVDSGRLVGIVTLQNLMHSIALVAERKRLRAREELDI